MIFQKGSKKVLLILLCVACEKITYAGTAQSRLRRTLIYAAKVGGVVAVQNALANGADVNARTNQGFTALIYADRNSRWQVASYLRQFIAFEQKITLFNQL